MNNCTKLSKEQKQLLIALLIGDGTISSNNVFKLSHSIKQVNYLEWKIKKLNQYGFTTNGIKTYYSTCGYNKGLGVVYTPRKAFKVNLLNWLTPLGIAVWYMDDGLINVNTSHFRSSVQHTVKISTCVDEATVKVMIQYFKNTWKIEFRPFREKKYYSLATRTEKDCIEFMKLVKPYILEVPSM